MMVLNMFWKILLLCCMSKTAVCRSPVVIVPGTGGNAIEAKLVGKPWKPEWYCYSTTNSYFALWLDVKSLLPWSIDCWVDNIRLEWDMKKMTVQNSPGVLTRTSGFGETSSFESVGNSGLLQYMKPLIDYLTTFGYKRGKDIRGAPFDFRYSPDNMPGDYHNKLKSLIEATYTINDKTPVTVLSHSYGCAVTLYFLSLQSQVWKSKYLKQWIPLSGVFGGTRQMIQLYASGLLMGVPKAVVNPLKLRDEQRSSTSNLYMLPANNLASPAKDQIIAKTKSRVYTIEDVDSFLNDIKFSKGPLMRRHIVNSTAMMKTSPGVPIHCFYGVMQDSTIETLEYEDNFPDAPSKTIMGVGDGTVNYGSLRLCGDFKNNQKETVTVTERPGVDHSGILNDKDTMVQIKDLLIL